MKKRLNIFCVCMIAAFLLSVSGNVYLIIEMFINGVEVGMKAAQGEITEIPQYKMVHVLPTDMIETTGTVTNLKDGRQLAVKPITALVECPIPIPAMALKCCKDSSALLSLSDLSMQLSISPN